MRVSDYPISTVVSGENSGHMKNIHEGGYTEEEKKFKCELCPKRFVEAWILKRHIKDHETNELKL